MLRYLGIHGAHSCCVYCRVMAPRYWTSRTAITFNFTEAFDPVTGPVRYQWCLGTSPGTDDALPLRDVVPRFNTTNFITVYGSELVRMSPVVRCSHDAWCVY